MKSEYSVNKDKFSTIANIFIGGYYLYFICLLILFIEYGKMVTNIN